MNEIKHIVAVASGKGGVGKSTTAINLALALKFQGHKVGLLDADVYGPSQQLMLGIADDVKPEQQGGQFLLPIEAHGLKTMSIGLSGERTNAYGVAGPDGRRCVDPDVGANPVGELDYLIIDMPPGTGDIQLTLSQKANVAGAVIVTTPQDIALLDARKGIEMFTKVDIPTLGVVENMAVHICSECGHTSHIFGASGGERISRDYGVPLLASLPLALSIREQTDSGVPTVVAEPDSEITALYLTAATAVTAALSNRGDDVVKQFPDITISDD